MHQSGTIWRFLWNAALSLLPWQRPKRKNNALHNIVINSGALFCRKCCFLLNKEVKAWPKAEDGAIATSAERVELWSFFLRTVCLLRGCFLSFVHLLPVFFVLRRTEHQFEPLISLRKRNNAVGAIFLEQWPAGPINASPPRSHLCCLCLRLNDVLFCFPQATTWLTLARFQNPVSN